MITINSTIQAGQNVFAYVANINGDEISVLTRIPDGATSEDVDDLVTEALTKIKNQLFKNEIPKGA